MNLFELLKDDYRFDGIWRAFVVDNEDPLRLGRVKVRVYPMMDGIDEKDLPWAEPCFPGYITIPAKGNWVWVMFQEGDLHRPVWIGWSIPFGVKDSVVYEKDAVGSIYDFQAFLAGDTKDEVGGEYPYATVFRHRSNSWFVFYDNGNIRLRNNARAEIVLYNDQKIEVKNTEACIRVYGNGRIEILNNAGARITLTEQGNIEIRGQRIDLN